MLTGERVLLRPFVAEDAVTMGAVLADPDVLRLTGSVTSTAAAHGADPEPDERLQQWYASRGVAEERLDLAVVDRAGDELVGEVVLNQYDEAASSANLRVLIGPGGRDRGLGTEACCLLLTHGFETVGLHRIELGVFAFNPRARRVYESLGFVAEGVRREAFCFDGSYVDEVVMAVLDHEWAGHRGRPDAWFS